MDTTARNISDNVHLLYVDDNPDFADIAAIWLERNDAQFAVETASSATDGLDRLTDSAFDCVISAYDMPGQNGIEFLKAVREEYPDLPFILYTGKGSEEVASDAISAGVTDYLQKERGTGQYTVLANRIRNAVEGNRSQRTLTKRQAELERKDRAMDAAPVGITISDPSQDDNPLIYVNDRFTGMTGHTEQEVLGSNCRFLQGEYTRPEPVARMREAIEDEEPVTVELRNYRKDGTEFWNRVVISPVRGDDGEVVNYVGFQQDVTEKKERERELRETKRRVEFVLEGTSTGIWEWTIGTDDIDWNDTLEQAVGLEPGSFEGTYDAFAKRVHPDDLPQVEAALNRAIETNELYEVEFRMIHENGETVWAECPAVIIEEEDGPDRMVGLHQDITERKRHEEQLESFAAVLTHDLRNPLNVASGYLELAQEEYESDHLDHVAEAHGRMGELIEDLLTLVSEGHTESNLEPVNLARITESCWENVPTAEATLTTDIDEEIRADPSRLQQLLENLFRNALEHGGEDVTVTVGTVGRGFYVEDDGPGIPEDEWNDVFEMGYSTRGGGTGFGLSIVKHVANEHGWEIRVTDSSEGGARFEITGVEFVGESILVAER